MKELTTKQQRQISGGSSLVYVVTSIIIAAGTGLSLRKIGTSKLHIGDASLVKKPVTTYKYEVEIN